MAYEQEPNEDTANPLTDGSAISGQLSSTSDSDLFYLSVNSAGALSVSFDAPTDSTEDLFDVAVIDADDNILASYQTGKDISFGIAAPSAGDYFVKITSDSDYSYTTDTYSITATHNEGDSYLSAYEQEHPDVLANPLTSGLPISGQLSSLIDSDLFYLSVDSAGELLISFDGPHSSFDIEVIDTDDNILAYYSSVYTLYESAEMGLAVPSAGDYFVKITSDSDYSYTTDTYSITATHNEGD
ncbi:MAG: PPC domain-containing protein, partial [Anaerolineales bacterium]|nr:PPC domain-containing protein [Anaerolineales bacterium]